MNKKNRAPRVRLTSNRPRPKQGVCRICGCTENKACVLEDTEADGILTCLWADGTKTLCTNPKCLAEARS